MIGYDIFLRMLRTRTNVRIRRSGEAEKDSRVGFGADSRRG